MYANREYSFDYFMQNVYNNEYVIITTNLSNERSKKLIDSIPKCRFIEVFYTVSMSLEKTIDDEFRVETNYNSIINNNNYKSLDKGLFDFVQILNEKHKKIIIDISSFHLRFLGAFLAAIYGCKWESIICTYTEPTAYPRAKEISPTGYNKNVSIGGFDLNSSFWGYGEIPNLKTVTNGHDNFVWIVFLGFEGKRADSVYTEISDDVKNVIPVITYPSIHPGWANYAFDANQLLFEKTKKYSPDIQYTDATNPFAAYNFIEAVEKDHNKQHIIISPLGTRPVSLGAILYAVKHEEAEIYFDTPKESSSNIVNVGNIHVYDILSFYN